jgi:hypothetical protein
VATGAPADGGKLCGGSRYNACMTGAATLRRALAFAAQGLVER